MILHIDMDAFFASIEQAVNSRFKGKPLIVGSRNNRLHTVVCAASYEAKAYGIDSGMPSHKAFQLCPNLEFVAADQSKYIWTSEQIFGLLKGYGFWLDYASIDEFRMDIAYEESPETLAKDIQKRIYANFNITASVGIAKNCLLAKLGSKINKPNGVFVFTEANITGTLIRVPVEKLCGVGSKLKLTLHNLGVKNCLDLYRRSAQSLEKNLGKYGLNLYVSLHSDEGLEGSEEYDKPKSMGHSYTLPMASQTPGFIRAWIRLLSEMVAERLRQKNLVSCTAHLWLNGPEMANFTAQQTFQQATNDGFEIFRRCFKIMAKLGRKTPRIRALGVTCSNLSLEDFPPLFKEQKRRDALIKTIDRINGRFGDGSIYPAVVNLTKFPADVTIIESK